ncbi:serum paraoxonase/lactonase 3-like [Acropora palmata]|uniref:serum paraoxonase/lactonase 3-like n=1 Tax=Acropora palmata TaxID=6131 RepID=UPI003DA19763
MRPHITLTFNKEYEDRKGKILTFDFNKPDEPPIELPLKNFNRTGFNPHGISFYRDPSTGVVSLFVINHRAGEQVVEIFDFDRQTHSLIHRRSVIDELIWSPNNLYAIGPDNFYVTNDNFFHGGSKLLSLLQICFLHESYVEIYVDSYTDNINVDPRTGKVWLAGIPRAADAALHSANLSHPSPSQVFEVNLGKASTSGVAFPDYEVREVYANDGKELSFVTTAIVYQDRLLVGTLDNNMLLCQLIHY